MDMINYSLKKAAKASTCCWRHVSTEVSEELFCPVSGWFWFCGSVTGCDFRLRDTNVKKLSLDKSGNVLTCFARYNNYNCDYITL